MSRDKESFYWRPEVHIRHCAVFGLIHNRSNFICWWYLALLSDLISGMMSACCFAFLSFFNFPPLVQRCFNREEIIEHLVDRVVKKGSRNATRNTEAKWNQSVVCSLSNVVYCAQTQPLPIRTARQEVRLFFHVTGLMAWCIWLGSRSLEWEKMPRCSVPALRKSKTDDVTVTPILRV